MTSVFHNLQPAVVWKHFEAINTIPRASTKEEQIIQYMVGFGNSLGLETSEDKVGNVIIKKPASLGKENHKTVVLQGHLDMVHQKEADSFFDFTTQGIEMFIDGDWIKAKRTTLGADNGIGVAAIMAVLSSDDIEHPPLEALFTIDEEMGMTGAMALTSNQLKGEVLLNLDTEEEDEIIIGCAGGVDVEIKGSYKTETLDDLYNFYEISIDGLTGGHSGMDIHLNRANAIKVLIQLLQQLSSKLEYRISMIEGGGLTNVIPRYCKAIIAIKDQEEFISELSNLQTKIQKEYVQTDPTLNFSLKRIEGYFSFIESKYQDEILNSINNIPNGIYAMTDGMDDLVQTSNNLARVSLKEDLYNIVCHTRSSIDAERNEVVQIIENCFPSAITKEIGPYPGWTPNPKSEILRIAKNNYKKLHNKNPKVKSIHAGLECGVLSEKYPKMEMISFGPNIRGAHSPDERLQISSTQNFWKFLKIVLEEI